MGGGEKKFDITINFKESLKGNLVIYEYIYIPFKDNIVIPAMRIKWIVYKLYTLPETDFRLRTSV